MIRNDIPQLTDGQLKRKKEEYYAGVIQKLKSDILTLETRLINADNIGANEENHKHHTLYKELKDKWNWSQDKLVDFEAALKEL